MANTALAKKHEQTAIATTDLTDFAIMTTDLAELREAVEAASNGQRINPFDLDVIKVPSGGMTAWAVPDIIDGERIEKAIEGVVVLQRSIRSWWRVGFDERAAQGVGKAPPDCSSQDGVWGVGHPDGHPDLIEESPRNPETEAAFAYETYDADGNQLSGPRPVKTPVRYACADCPLAQFGSGKDGRGQACRQNRLLFLLREDSALPAVVKVPPSSLKPVQSFFLKLSGKAVSPWAIVVSLGLRKVSGSANIEYAEIVPTPVARLDEAAVARIKATAEALKPALLGATIEADL